MKEKLELKDLAPYLPYELKGLECLKGELHELIQIKGDKKHPFIWENKDRAWISNRIDCKPVLRHISDLTKEIEHNGEKFVPMELIKSGAYPIDYFEDNEWLEDYLEAWILSKDKTHHPIFVPSGLIQQFREWNFAIDIPEHLYIDINTLKK